MRLNKALKAIFQVWLWKLTHPLHRRGKVAGREHEDAERF